jgi:hypothetical protein
MRASVTAILLATVGLSSPCLAAAQSLPPDGSVASPPPVNGSGAPPNTPSTPATSNPHDSLIGNAPPDRSAVAKKNADDRKMQRCITREKSLHGNLTEAQMKEKCQKQIVADQ